MESVAALSASGRAHANTNGVSERNDAHKSMEYRLMRNATKVRIVGIALGLGGFALVWMHAGWVAAAGVFLALWGNNLGLRAHSAGAPTNE
jgi:hypothetical protein